MPGFELRLEGVKINQQQVDLQGGAIVSKVHRMITRRGATQARVDVPVDTGALGRSIREELPVFEGPLHIRGGVSAGPTDRKPGNYALFVHEGTRAHGPVRAKALRFEIAGRVIFAKRVRGVKARPFLRNAVERVAREVVG